MNSHELITYIVKEIAFKVPTVKRLVFGRYPFMFEPDQLYMFMRWLQEIRDIPGSCVEIGCAYGSTTIFLKKYMDRIGLNRRYIAIDTFSGFVPEHAEFDIDVLGKDPSLAQAFRVNKRGWFIESLKLEHIAGVEVIEADATAFDYATVKPIAFCLLDVDLYKPTSAILPRIYNLLSPGGLIVVDDCRPNPAWEGALVAYDGFVSAHHLKSHIVCEKLGVIRRERAESHS